MRIIPTRETNGRWVDPIPFVISTRDLEALIPDQKEREIVVASLGNRLDNVCRCEKLPMVVGCYSDRDSEERARISNKWYNTFNGTARNLRAHYFRWVGDGQMKVGEQLEYDFATKVYNIPGTEPVTREHECCTEEFKLLLSTRKLLGFLGVGYYDGPEFKFKGNRHPSPAESYVQTLAKEYLMKLIIPNALLAVKHGKTFGLDAAILALDHCMTAGKSPESVLYWQALKADATRMNPVLEKYTFYVLGKRRDGRDIEADHRCYFDKYVSLKGKDAPKFKRGKNQDVVDSLLKRMESEPALKTMSHRQLMASGITNRAARLFMAARKRR